jgi:hypothetical protein
MPSGALVKGGAGSEIALRDILPSNLRGAQRAVVEPIARKYEEKNPGAVVICDWELFDDQDIAAMTPIDREKAMEDRQALANRRKLAAEYEPPDAPSRGGDPDRVRELIRRAKNDIERLQPESPSYKTLFIDLARQINQLERSIGVEPTQYQINMKMPSTKLELTKPQREEYSRKVEMYRKLTKVERKNSIEQAKDAVLSQMLFDVETDDRLRQAWTMKLVELNAIVEDA